MAPLSSLSLSERQVVEVQLIRDKALVMYRQLPNVLIFTFVATSALILYYREVEQLWFWWAGMQLVTAMRFVTLMFWRRHWSTTGVVADSQKAIRLFVAFSLISGLLWAVFSISFFAASTSSQRLVIALVMATVAAGSVNVLALVPWASRLFIAFLIAPLVVLFASTGQMDDLVVAGLGIALFIGLTGFAKVASGSASHLLVAAQQREFRLANAASQRDELLRDKNSLESRLAEKIERLEFEITLKERYARELSRMAELDTMTGLLNRSAFERELHHQLDWATSADAPIAIFALEILRFDVLELQGARATEQILVSMAGRLRRFFGEDVLIARWGGAEFAVAVPDPEQRWNDRGLFLRANLQEAIEVDDGALRVDVMIGIAPVMYAVDLDTLIYRASVAKHSLRQQGIGGVKVFDEALDVVIRQRQKLRRALHASLETDDLKLVFQPIEPCAANTGGKIVPRKMEALLRWDEPELGAVSPALFIPVAEESGLIMPLGRWVLLEACRTALAWPDAAIVCVNVSVQQILAGDLLQDVNRALAISGLVPSRLQIEITESVFSQDIDRVCSVLEQVRKLGVTLAIDDFGTGYSSLAYLRHLPVDVIKIDRSFIQDLDQGARKLLVAMVSMARGLGFRIVVEGVETVEQQNLLISMGVDYLQGYLIARPMAANDAKGWLARGKQG
ncbi:MAG: EAL domain-containing protein [Cellvibrio sp.]|uniref:putative bifunctional diguanylate cyclase/phosphodiesterase n=1 Tax=Cellvibrio sp. TaxID=1965322 RepID=UPI0031B3B3A6